MLTKMAGKDRTIVSLDNPSIRSLAKEAPELFLQCKLYRIGRRSRNILAYCKAMAVVACYIRTCGADTTVFKNALHRDSNNKEIDLLIYQNATLYPIEIKKGTQPKNATKHFSVLKKFTDDKGEQKTVAGNGAVICLASDAIPIDRLNCYVPAWII